MESAAVRSGVILNKIDVAPGLISDDSSAAKDAAVAGGSIDNDILSWNQISRLFLLLLFYCLVESIE